MLEEKLVKRKVSLKALDYGKVEEAAGGTARQVVQAQRRHLVARRPRELNKHIKALGLKGIQSQTQGEQLRVTGKKRDDLQAVIADPEGRTTSASRCSSRTSGTEPRTPAAPRGYQAFCQSPAAEAGDAVLDRRVGAEQVAELHLATGQRVDDVRLGLGRVDVHRDWLGVRPRASRRARASGSPSPMSRAPVRSASYSRLRRERHLQQAGGERGEDRQREQGDGVAVVVVTAAAAEDGAAHGACWR